jgi:predicted thioesterase
MGPDPVKALTGEISFVEVCTVAADQTAKGLFGRLSNGKAYASQMVEGLATEYLVAIVESICIREMLRKMHLTTEVIVGAAEDIRHLAPVPPGKQLWLRGRTTHLSDRKAVFAVQACDDHEVVCEGTMTFVAASRVRMEACLARKVGDRRAKVLRGASTWQATSGVIAALTEESASGLRSLRYAELNVSPCLDRTLVRRRSQSGPAARGHFRTVTNDRPIHHLRSASPTRRCQSASRARRAPRRQQLEMRVEHCAPFGLRRAHLSFVNRFVVPIDIREAHGQSAGHDARVGSRRRLLSGPGFGSPLALGTPVLDGGQYRASYTDEGFGCLAALNAKYPLGSTCTFTATASNPALNQTRTNPYPANLVPTSSPGGPAVVPLLSGASFASLQGLDAASAHFLAFNTPFFGAGPETDLEFAIFDVATVRVVYGSGFLPATTTGLLLPANTLAANTDYAFALGYHVFELINGGGVEFENFTFSEFRTTAAVPEPATITLLGVGLAGFGFWRRRKHR